MIFWLSLVLFLGCQTAGTEVGKAVMLEQQGDLVAAFDIYTAVMQTYPNSSEAKMSLRRVQRMQLKTAKTMEKVDPNRSVRLYQSMVERWPNTEYAQLAAQKIATLTSSSSSKNASTAINVQQETDALATASVLSQDSQDKEDQGQQAIENAIDNSDNGGIPDMDNNVVQKVSAEEESVLNDKAKPSSVIANEAEVSACETARQSTSRVVWQQYKQAFPTGICIEEAEEFLRVVAPRQMEIDQAKSKARNAQRALVSLCKEYRLIETTSNPKACANPSQALMTEFARLQKRKSDLLSSGDAEKEAYYVKWIPPRWNTLSTAESKACGELLDFVSELDSEGIDRAALESELTMVRTCFVNQGTIDG